MLPVQWSIPLAALSAGLAAGLFVRRSGDTLGRVRTEAAAEPGRLEPSAGWGLGVSKAALSLPRRLVPSIAVAASVGLVVRGLGGTLADWWWVAVAVVSVVCFGVLGRLDPVRSRRRSERLVLDLPQALDLLAACLAAGMPLRTATVAVAEAFDGPVAEDLGQVLVVVDLGVADADAWRSLTGHPQWGPAAVDLARSVESGTLLVEVLRHHARQARNQRRASLEVVAKSVGVRSVLPLMTCFLPAFMLLGIVPTVASAVGNALSVF